MQTSLRKSLVVTGLALGAAVIGQNAIADQGDTLHWQSVIGIAQANGVVGIGTGAVTGGGTPWSTLGGQVNVHLESGIIDFDVHGLVLAGGNSIGTPGTILQVIANGTVLR
jgi:hypothetical protein